ncbi:MAG: family 10 glycosylhydrolase [Terriglobia bacterium]
MRSRLIALSTFLISLPVHSWAQSHIAQPWYQQAMRWGQVNINELDAQGFDVKWWMSYFQRCHVDGITVNAAGFVAYYPSQVPLHPRSRFLGNRDLFGEIVTAARKAGLHVLARFDPSYQRQDFYAAHPDWFSVDRTGKPNLLSWPPEPREKLYMICPNSPYFWEYMPKIFEEILTHYDVDGIFGNAWNGYDDICYCAYCRSRFQKDTGQILPNAEDRSDPVYRAWVT